MPTLEFIDSVLFPNSVPYKIKIARLVNTYGGDATIQDIDNIDFLYEAIVVSLDNLKMLYDNQYAFDHAKIASINSFMMYFDENTDNYTQNEASKYANYLIN